MRRLVCLGYGLVLALGGVGAAAAQPAGGPPIDPRQMSGIGRVDPQVEAGSVTVRCLLGGFDAPAVGVEVTLEVRTADGGLNDRLGATTDEAGRATFSGLERFYGGSAVASATLAGELQRSEPLPVTASAGTRVMLVQGAASRGAAAGPERGGAEGGTPAPGQAFEDERFPRGTVVVGALDLAARGGVADTEVSVVITPPAGEVVRKTGRTDRQGRAVFPELLPPEVPEGSQVVVEATLQGVVQRSEPFSLGEQGMIVVLTTGTMAEAPAAGPPQRRPLVPPRMLPTVARGAVRLTVTDGRERPVAGQAVTVVMRDSTGGRAEFLGITGADGIALVEDVEVVSDAAYEALVSYQGAPYRSAPFRMGETMGVAAELRVFPTTADLSRVRSATQFEVIGRENDAAQVGQLYQVFVSGEEAFWTGRPLEIHAAEGAFGFVVMDRASPILEHTDKAPFARLVEPIPPGQVIDLSIAYLLEHDGVAKIRWTPSLPLVDASVLVGKELRLEKGAKGPPTPPPQAPEAPFEIYEVGGAAVGQALELEVSGLPVRPRLIRDLGWQVGIGLFVLIAFALRPRRSPRELLLARKTELVAALDRAEAAGADGERAAIVAELDQVFHQLDALAGVPAAPSAGG